MRTEAKRIYDQISQGIPLSEIHANKKTKAKMHRIYLYRQLIGKLIEDISLGRYTLSTPTIEKLLNDKKGGR